MGLTATWACGEGGLVRMLASRPVWQPTGKQFGNRSAVPCLLPKVVASAPPRTVARRAGFPEG